MSLHTTVVVTALMVACGDQGEVFVYRGPLSSTSGAAATINPDRYEVSVVGAGDVNGDGRSDFVVLSDEGTDLYFGVHEGADATTIDHEELVPLGDVNADGRADLLVGSLFYPGSAHPFERSGTALPHFVLSATSADVDGDGITDLVVASVDDGQPRHCNLSVLRGGPTFDVNDVPESSVVLPLDGSPTLWLDSAGDIDGDGSADLVLEGSCLGTGELAVYFGGPLVSEPSRVVAMGRFPVLARDFDGDGFGDLAVTDDSDPTLPTVLVYFGPGLDTPRLRLPGKIADAGDIDGDGHPDLLVIQSAGDVGMYFGGPAMDDTLDIALSSPKDRPFGSVAYLGDVDGDGHADLAVAYAGWRAE